MKHLTAEQLTTLDAYWKNWAAETVPPKQRRIRLRLHLVYLLIRHGGLRLGEALALDDNRDLVFSTSTIHISGSRDVQVQEHAMHAILRIVEAPELSELHGTLSHIDPGFIRKNFYQAATACGLGRTLGGPRVLRHSRGTEMLEQGVPVAIVQKYLGLQSPVQAVQLREFHDNEAQMIIHAHLRREALRHTSARNAFAGEITEIQESSNMAQVTLRSVSGLTIVSMISMESMRNLNLRVGQNVTATVKAPWVIMVPLGTESSCSNTLPATVLFVKKGTLEASVRLRVDDGTGMAAMTSMASIERMGIVEGRRVMVTFSAMSVVLAPA